MRLRRLRSLRVRRREAGFFVAVGVGVVVGVEVAVVVGELVTMNGVDVGVRFGEDCLAAARFACVAATAAFGGCFESAFNSLTIGAAHTAARSTPVQLIATFVPSPTVSAVPAPAAA